MRSPLSMFTGLPEHTHETMDEQIVKLRRQLNLEAMGLKRATILARNHLMEEIIRPPGARKDDDEIH